MRAMKFWVQFRVRALLVLVTLCVIFFGWEFNWKNQRQAFLRHNVAFSGIPHPKAPGLLWIVGETGYNNVEIQCPSYVEQCLKSHYHTDAPPDAVEARRLFPEAEIQIMDGDYVIAVWEPGWEWIHCYDIVPNAARDN
jgi:hypothetical protein